MQKPHYLNKNREKVLPPSSHPRVSTQEAIFTRERPNPFACASKVSLDKGINSPI
jgi:hypothetical protein